MCHCEPSEWNEFKTYTGEFAWLSASTYFAYEYSKRACEYGPWPEIKTKRLLGSLFMYLDDLSRIPTARCS